jgi:hypothetical protein
MRGTPMAAACREEQQQEGEIPSCADWLMARAWPAQLSETWMAHTLTERDYGREEFDR